MTDLVTALGLVLVLEGIIYGGLPGLAKRMAAEMTSMPEQWLRLGGVAAVALGVALVWLARG